MNGTYQIPDSIDESTTYYIKHLKRHEIVDVETGSGIRWKQYKKS